VNPRSRVDTYTPRARSRTEALQGRKRAVTMVDGHFSPPLPKSSDALDPVLLEMKKGELLDAGNILNDFNKLCQRIRDFCDACAVHVGEFKQLPRMGPHAASPDTLIGKPAREFASAEDYVFFVIISTITNRIYQDIFRPFHPTTAPDVKDRYEEEYLKTIDACM
jgi:hypothetical protein